MIDNKVTKADLLRMLADAVRNTPGAVPIEPDRDTRPEPSRRVSKAKRATVSSSRKQNRRSSKR